ncbi:MAG TPA: tetratricopeptide repeat protein, partial [Roseiflexaceae bacterium]|nr:tetratricopeptide repeat protein [Roseiflexaceae bacterium]
EESAVSVLSPQSSVLNGLVALVDKSLLRQEEGTDGAPRFMMLETVREYALERLVASGEQPALRQQHALYYLAAAIDVGQEGEPGVMEHSLVVEIDNLRTALRWALDQREAEIALRLSTVLYYFHQAVQYSEGRAWLEASLAMCDAADASPATKATRTEALEAASWAAVHMGEYDRAQMHFAARLAESKDLGDLANMALAQRSLGWVAQLRSNLVDAQNWIEQSLALCREAHDAEGIAWSLHDLGYLEFVRGELAHAEQLLAESLALMRDQKNEHGIIRACLGLGHVARAQGQLARATTWYRESITSTQHSFYFARYIIPALEGLAAVMAAQGHVERAARLFGAAETLREVMGVPVHPVERANYKRDVAATQAQLDEAAFAAARAAGRTLTLEQVTVEALSNDAAQE